MLGPFEHPTVQAKDLVGVGGDGGPVVLLPVRLWDLKRVRGLRRSDGSPKASLVHTQVVQSNFDGREKGKKKNHRDQCDSTVFTLKPNKLKKKCNRKPE